MGAIEEVENDVGLCAVCQGRAELKCMACKAVFYCSRACQKRHWKKHKFECKSLPYRVSFCLQEINWNH